MVLTIDPNKRQGDSDLDPHVAKKVQVRIGTTLGGLVVAIGGVALALTALLNGGSEKVIIVGMVSALIGAGAMDPSTFLNFFKGQRGDD